MAERAHPDNPGFRNRFALRWWRHLVPYVVYERSPYRAALCRRYEWINHHCRGKDVLDIPCGMGWGTSLLQGCRSVVGVDCSREAIADAQARYGNQARFLVGTMEALAFADESLDLVACLEGIEHVPQNVAETFLREVHRVLRPGGQLLLSSPHGRDGRHSGNPFHIHEYTREEMTQLLQRHFTIEELFQRNVAEVVVHFFRARKADVSGPIPSGI